MRSARVTTVRVALSLALLVFGAAAVGNGFDRLSGASPTLERLVPRLFRAQADRSAVLLASARNRRDAALANARAAVSSDPVDPAAAPLLGAALLMRNDAAGAEQAFRVSARLGWRDVPTQAYWYEAALEAGEMAPAADRLDALLRANPALTAKDALIARIEASAAGQRELAKRLVARPGWAESYLMVGELPADEVARRVSVLAQVSRSGVRLGCDFVQPFVTAALSGGNRRQAEAVWLAHCPGAAISGGLADAGFDTFGSEQASPFGWQVPPSGDVIAEPVGTGPARAVQLSNRASVSRLVLTQSLAVPAGHYRLTAKAAAGQVSASVACGPVPGLPRMVEGDLATSGQVLDIPACDTLILGLWLRPTREPVTLDAVSLTRL